MLTTHGAQQQQKQQPAQPVYVLRGHSAQIHALLFTRGNERLVTADADGWVVMWNVATRRPVSVWKAHEGAVMNVAEWGGRLLTFVFPLLGLHVLLEVFFGGGRGEGLSPDLSVSAGTRRLTDISGY